MKTIGTFFLLAWLLMCASAQPEPNAPIIDPATGLPTGTNFGFATQPVKRLQGLDFITDKSNLVFKGIVTSTDAETNAAFPDWGKPHATKFKVITFLKGGVHTNVVMFHHNTKGPNAWGGGTPPWHCSFEVGQSYIVFAAKADKPDYLYSPSSNNVTNSYEYRQPMGEYAFRTLDSRALGSVSIKEAVWTELIRILNSGVATNSLYAIQHLNRMSKSCLAAWGHDDDFKREAVLMAVLPFVTHDDDQVAIHAIGCFQLGGNTGTFITDLENRIPILRGCSELKPECVVQVSPYATTLVDVANKSSSIPRRIAAIAAFSCTGFSIVSNSLPQWLVDASEQVRAQAVLLLPDFPGEWSEQLLQKQDMDSSPKIRSMVATAIGNGQLEQLIPVLVNQFSEPLGPTNPIPPLTLEELQSGGRLLDENVGDVHTSAGYALLKFDVNQVGDILRTNLNDVGFRMQFLCKLAENDPGPWLTNLVGELKTRRERIWKEVESSVNDPKTNYYRSRMTLSGAYFTCWNMIYHHLANLPDSAFADGKLDWSLDELEDSGCADSNRPIEIYELYRSKGLNDRAARLRRENGKYDSSYDLSPFFDRIDAQKSKKQK